MDDSRLREEVFEIGGHYASILRAHRKTEPGSGAVWVGSEEPRCKISAARWWTSVPRSSRRLRNRSSVSSLPMDRLVPMATWSANRRKFGRLAGGTHGDACTCEDHQTATAQGVQQRFREVDSGDSQTSVLKCRVV